MGDLGWERRNYKVRERSKKTGSKKIPQVDQSFWQETIRIDAHKKSMESCYRHKRRFCAKKEKGVSIVKREKRRGTQNYKEAVKERLHQTLKVISDSTGILCRKER